MFLEDSHLQIQSQWVAQLLNWYDSHKRDFPWRRAISVYHTWICEVMSQQTTMAVVVPRFENFIRVLPTLSDLAHCSDDVLRELWMGLGYYARARNLRKGAHFILSDRGGEFPACYEDWLNVPGVGPYTASVISSICFSEPKACVDGNVIRVIARLTGCTNEELWTESGKKSVQAIVDCFIDIRRPGDFNQAMMELGATVCQKQSPDCERCPLSDFCLAKQHQKTHLCPPNKPRKNFETVELDALRVLDVDGQQGGGEEWVLLVERKRGFLSETVGFPLFKESERSTLLAWLQKNDLLKSLEFSEDCLNHTITHHQIKIRTLDVQLSNHPKARDAFVNQLNVQFSGHFTAHRWVSKTVAKKAFASSLDRKIWEKISLF